MPPAETEILLRYFPGIDQEQLEQYQMLRPLYEEWNSKINVISRKDMDNLYVHHVLHALSIAKIIALDTGSQVLDIGTGGGFPGIPLAIMYPGCKFTLLDARAKKIKVVNEVASALGLENVRVIHGRAEDHEGKYNFIVSRAVARLKVLFNWTENNFQKGGKYVFLKGGDLDDEIKEAGIRLKEYQLSEFFKEDFFLSKKGLFGPVQV